MTEIDFIPDWYHANRRRRLWYRRRYMMIAAVMVIWLLGNLIAGGIISRAHADLNSLRLAYEKGLQKIEQSKKLEVLLRQLEHQDSILSGLCPRTPSSAVLAELTSCVGPRVVLTELTLSQIPADQPETREKTNPARVQLAASSGAEKTNPVPEVPTAWKAVFAGRAMDGSEVAGLIARLEESDFFTRVIPGFSRNGQWKDQNVTEFEISCIVADFVLLGNSG